MFSAFSRNKFFNVFCLVDNSEEKNKKVFLAVLLSLENPASSCHDGSDASQVSTVVINQKQIA